MTGPQGSAGGAAALVEALSGWTGARIDAVHGCPATGLIAIAVYVGARRVLGVAVGPRVAGVGLLPRVPRHRAAASQPLVAAMRAHLVGRRVLAIEVHDGGLRIVVQREGADAGADAGAEAEAEAEAEADAEADAGADAGAEAERGGATIELVPGRRGEARLFSASGNLIARWPPQAGAPAVAVAYPPDPAAAGAALVEASDAAADALAKAALARAVKARRAALERRAAAVRGDLARLDDVALLQKSGQLLLAQGSRVPRGAKAALLDDWDTGGTIEIALDPARPVRAQAEAFFARARRYQRGEIVLRGRLDETERALQAVAALEAELAAAEPSPEALEPLAKRARALGVAGIAGGGGQGDERPAAWQPRPPPGPPARAGKPAPRRPFHLFRSAGGGAILVGRGGEDNDTLTTKHARPHDLWLHAKGVPGAHVVVPLQKGASCPADVLVDAATLAAHFSDARGEVVCEVSYVPRRYVRKPRGAAPGAVTHDREKVIAVRVEKERLARLLATKEEA